jgi:two-component system, cell cycle response regulator DivK
MSVPPEAEHPLVLLVDDNDRNRKLVADLLRAADVRTLEAGSGAEAIALAVVHGPDVILLDLGLPDMDAGEVMRRLERSDATARIPVVATSASPLEASGDRLLAAGFAGWLEKPIVVGTFVDRVRAYFAGSPDDPDDHRAGPP